MILHTLTKLEYSKDLRGPFVLYVFGRNGYHSGGQSFAKVIRYPGEQISVDRAKARVEAAVADKREVRICDGGDMLVYHSVGGRQLYPDPSINFWEAVERA